MILPTHFPSFLQVPNWSHSACSQVSFSPSQFSNSSSEILFRSFYLNLGSSYLFPSYFLYKYLLTVLLLFLLLPYSYMFFQVLFPISSSIKCWERHSFQFLSGFCNFLPSLSSNFFKVFILVIYIIISLLYQVHPSVSQLKDQSFPLLISLSLLVSSKVRSIGQIFIKKFKTPFPVLQPSIGHTNKTSTFKQSLLINWSIAPGANNISAFESKNIPS